MSRLLLSVLSFAVMVFLTAQDAQQHPATALSGPPHEFQQRLIGLTTKSGEMQKILAEIAVTPPEWERGLMGRTTLADNAGMLFDFGEDRPITMWMKDTPLSLDMLFIADDGRVVAIARDTVPFSEAIISAPQKVRYVLEVRGGQSAVWGIEPGSHLIQIAR